MKKRPNTSHDPMDPWMGHADQLHSAPHVARSILNLTRDPHFDVDALTECLTRDPALSAKLLRIVNSSRYGLRHKVASLRQAVTFLGQRTIRLVAMTFSIVGLLTRGASRVVYDDFWRRALSNAIVAERISRGRQDVDGNDAYTAGLLSDLGILLLTQVKGQSYSAMYRACQSDQQLQEAECAAYGFDHATLGAKVLAYWEFPEPLVEAVRDHHHPDKAEGPLAVAACAGTLMADALWNPSSHQVPFTRTWLAQHYNLDTDGFIELALQCKSAIEIEAELHGIHLPEIINWRSLLEEARRRCLETSLEATLDLDSMTSLQLDLSR